MKTILGAVRPTAGTVEFEGEVINEVRTAGRIERGLAIVPENRRGFPRVTARENPEMGAVLRRGRAEVDAERDRVLPLVPRPRERLLQRAGSPCRGARH